jgi:hypothetical protein
VKRRTQRADDRVDQVGENVLGVVELDAGEISGWWFQSKRFSGPAESTHRTHCR